MTHTNRITGPISVFGEPALAAAQLAVDEINKEGGINGKTIVLVSQDDQGQPQAAVDIIHQMQSAQKINKFIQFAGATLSATAPQTEHTAFILNPSIRTDNLRGKYEHIFNLGQSPDKEMERLIVHLKKAEKNKVLNIALIYKEDAFGNTYKNAFLRQSINKTKAIELGYAPGESDYKSIVTKIKNRNIDSIVLIANPHQAALFLKQLKELDVNIPVYMNWLGESKILVSESKETSEGIIFVYPFKEKEDSRSKEKYALFNEKKIELHPLMLNSYDAVYLLKEVLEKCQEDDLECLSKETKRIKFNGISGSFSFQEGMAIREIYLKEIKEGNFIFL